MTSVDVIVDSGVSVGVMVTTMGVKVGSDPPELRAGTRASMTNPMAMLNTMMKLST
jgi:hypothetical protein